MTSAPSPEIVSTDNPQTLREVGIHLGNLSKTIDQNILTVEEHHRDNILRYDAIMKKLEEMSQIYPTRKEFDDFKKYIEASKIEILKDADAVHKGLSERIDKKSDRWVQQTIIWIGGIVGTIIIGALLNLIIYKPSL